MQEFVMNNKIDLRKLLLLVVATIVVVAVAFGLFQALGDDDSTDDGATAEQSDTTSDGEPDATSPDDDAADAGDSVDAPVPADDPDEATDDSETGDDVIVFEITKVCGITFHTPIDDDSLSHIVWKFTAPGFEEGQQLRLRFSDGSEDVAVVVDNVISVEQGISSYGDYAFPEVSWDEADNLESTITPDGTHLVDEKEGLPSETCLE